jgi:hypothetical protein
MSRKFYTLWSLVLIVAFALAACGPTATEAPVATEAPAMTEAPTVAPPTEGPPGHHHLVAYHNQGSRFVGLAKDGR